VFVLSGFRILCSRLLTRLELGWFVVAIVSSSGRMGFLFLLLRSGRCILRVVPHAVYMVLLRLSIADWSGY